MVYTSTKEYLSKMVYKSFNLNYLYMYTRNYKYI